VTGNGCPVEGCTASLGRGSYRERHIRQPHVRCSCGWVGMAKSFRSHVGSIRRADRALGRESVPHERAAVLRDHLRPPVLPAPVPPPADSRPVIEI